MTVDIGRLRKKDLRVLTLSEMNITKPDLKNIPYTRARAIGDWMKSWIDENIANGTLKGLVALPNKNELAYFLGVSAGTVQSAFMDLETRGCVICKQCMGTIVITDRDNPPKFSRRNCFSRDIVENIIKKYIIENNYKAGDSFLTVRAMSREIGRPYPITRFAMLSLVEAGVLEHEFLGGWRVKSVENLTYEDMGLKKESLVDRLYDDLKQLIQDKYKPGDKFMLLKDISENYGVSVKSAFDAVKRLSNEGIIVIRHGNYGSRVKRLPFSDPAESPEMSIFASADDGNFYFFEKVYKELKHLINAKYQVGDRLPNMYSLAHQFEVSTSVVRLAVKKLVKEGVLVSKRGRFAGTVVTSMPEIEGESSYKWLSVNPVFVKTYQKVPKR